MTRIRFAPGIISAIVVPTGLVLGAGKAENDTSVANAASTRKARTVRRRGWIPIAGAAVLAVTLSGCTKDATRTSAATSTAVTAVTAVPAVPATAATSTTIGPDANVFCSAWADYQLSWGTGNTQTIDEHYAAAKALPPLAPPPISSEVSNVITSILPSPGVDNADPSGTALRQAQVDTLNILRWMKANCSTPSLHGWPLDPILAALEAKFGSG